MKLRDTIEEVKYIINKDSKVTGIAFRDDPLGDPSDGWPIFDRDDGCKTDHFLGRKSYKRHHRHFQHIYSGMDRCFSQLYSWGGHNQPNQTLRLRSCSGRNDLSKCHIRRFKSWQKVKSA